MSRRMHRKFIGSAGCKADATNPFYQHNMQVMLEEQKFMKEQEQSKAKAAEKSDQGSTEFRPTKEEVIDGLKKQALAMFDGLPEVSPLDEEREKPNTNTAASLAIADEILMRIAPESKGLAVARVQVLEVIERDKADVLALLRELGQALDSNAELNTYTGEFCTVVNPDFFGRLRRALERHTGVRVMDRLQLP